MNDVKHADEFRAEDWIDCIAPFQRIQPGDHFTEMALCEAESRLKRQASGRPTRSSIRDITWIFLIVLINGAALAWGLSGIVWSAPEPATSKLVVSKIYYIDPSACHLYNQIEE